MFVCGSVGSSSRAGLRVPKRQFVDNMEKRDCMTVVVVVQVELSPVLEMH